MTSRKWKKSPHPSEHCWFLGELHIELQFYHRACLRKMESCSKFCGGSPLDTGLLQLRHLQWSHPSWINKSQHCHNGALLTPTHSHTHRHTNIRLVIQEGIGTQTHTHTYKTPDPSQIRTFLTPKWDPGSFPRLRALSDKESCYVSAAVHASYTLYVSAEKCWHHVVNPTDGCWAPDPTLQDVWCRHKYLIFEVEIRFC